MENNGISFRFAEKKDAKLVLDFIIGIAEYEKMLDDVVANEKMLEENLFDQKKGEVLFVLADGKEVGFALFFHNFSTFLGRAGIYLEDLFVYPQYRGKGYGKALLTQVAKIACERNCGRLEWVCLDWNKPSIDFYESLGAKQLNEWLPFRLSGEDLQKLGQK